MLTQRMTARCVLAYLIIDVLFGPLLTFAFVSMLDVELGSSLFLVLLIMLAKSAAGSAFLSFALAPYERLARRESGRDDLLVAADRAISALPHRFSLAYATGWVATFALVFLTLSHASPEAIGARSVDAAALAVAAMWFGGFAVSFPLAIMLTTGAANGCSLLARQRGVTLDRDPIALQSRIGVIALALALGPTFWMMALGYTRDLQGAWEQRGTLTELAASELAGATDAAAVSRFAHDFTERHAAGIEIVSARLTDRSFKAPEPEPADLAPARDWLKAQAASTATAGVWSPRNRDLSVAYRRIGSERAAVVLLRTPGGASRGYVLSSILFSLVIVIWAPLCAVVLGRAVSEPILRLTRAAREIVEEGKQSEMSALPVARADEVGVLTDRFNDLIDMMRDLSVAADAIAKGDLRVDVRGKGELPDAFRGMLGSLRTMVHQIGETSIELGSAATEIFAASQEQEAAAASQSSAMEEISRTMDSLSASAAHVSEAVRGVLSNAERTLDNTDAMVKRITELSAHAGRIAEILEVIREIADKSDLLALNGSLEANRAGEQGHGFALVAAEMRRLAERVTASVQDVKRLVTDIRESGSTTVMATEESRRLAQGTTEAARQITFVTQQQRSGTEQVSQSVKGIADVVTQAVSATAQTRTSAERLKAQADRLTSLVRRFETANEQAA